MNQPHEINDATYLARNRWMTALGFAPWALSAICLLLGLVTRNPPLAALSRPLFFGGIPAFIYVWNKNPRSRRTRVAVSASAEGVRLRGEGSLPSLPRAQIKEGFILPAIAGSSHRVHLVRRGLAPPVELEVRDEAEGRAVLRALGLDASQTVATFRTASRVVAHPNWIAPLIISIMALSMASGALVPALKSTLPFAGLFPFIFLAFFVTLLFPTRIDVGADGILMKWLWQRRFIPYSDLEAVRSYQRKLGRSRVSGVALWLRGGEEVVIPVSQRGWGEERSAIVEERIREAMAAYREGGAEADAMLLRRADRPVREWITTLRAIGAGANADLRVAPVAPERLFRIVEDPSAKPSARAAAAVALSAAGSEDVRARLKAAAEATAAPRLRIALDAAARDGGEAAIEEALAELDAAEAEPVKAKAKTG